MLRHGGVTGTRQTTTVALNPDPRGDSMHPAALVPLALLPLAQSQTLTASEFDRPYAFAQPTAVSYAPDLVPYGSEARVTVTRSAGHTTVRVELAGVAADHSFPAHVHTGRCGSTPDTSGPHYQNVKDPARADDRNEMRLTVRTDHGGSGTAASEVGWLFRPGEAHSLVLHAGTPAGRHAADDRVACVNMSF
jgi:Cu-Zn family superoxide dismutase